MSDYIGKICPFCKTEIRAEDEIVVCSACDMPHHKECWIENQGCTTFGCLGTIKTAEGGVNSVTTNYMNYGEQSTVSTGTIFCTQCGAQQNGSSAFCTQCGSKLVLGAEPVPQPPVYTQSNPANSDPYAYTNQQNNTYQQNYAYQQSNTYQQSSNYQQYNNYQQGNSYANTQYNAYSSYQNVTIDPDVQQLVGTKMEYYIPKFQELKAQNKQTSWNWAAFLVAPYWFVYRKMYGYGISAFAIGFIISKIGSPILSFLSLGAYAVIGIFANYIYMKFLEGKAQIVKNMSEPVKVQYINTNGGVNSTATVLAFFGYVLLALITM